MNIDLDFPDGARRIAVAVAGRRVAEDAKLRERPAEGVHPSPGCLFENWRLEADGNYLSSYLPTYSFPLGFLIFLISEQHSRLPFPDTSKLLFILFSCFRSYFLFVWLVMQYVLFSSLFSLNTAKYFIA